MDAEVMIKKIWQNATCRIKVRGIAMLIIELLCMFQIYVLKNNAEGKRCSHELQCMDYCLDPD